MKEHILYECDLLNGQITTRKLGFQGRLQCRMIAFTILFELFLQGRTANVAFRHEANVDGQEVFVTYVDITA